MILIYFKLRLNVVENSEFSLLPIRVKRRNYPKEYVSQLVDESKDERKEALIAIETLTTMVQWVAFRKDQKKIS